LKEELKFYYKEKRVHKELICLIYIPKSSSRNKYLQDLGPIRRYFREGFFSLEEELFTRIN